MRVCLASLPLLAACSYHVPTPAARGLPLETGEVPGPGTAEVQLEANRAGWIPSFTGADDGALRVGVGVTPNVAVSAEGGLVRVHGGMDGGVDAALDVHGVDTVAGVGRVGVEVHREEPQTSPVRGLKVHNSAFSGAGGGYNEVLGRWVSFDLGAATALETTHATPFANVALFGTVPIDPPTFSVQIQSDEGDWDETYEKMDRLRPSAGITGTTGVELRAARSSPVSLLLGVSLGATVDAEQLQLGGGFGAALRIKAF